MKENISNKKRPRIAITGIGAAGEDIIEEESSMEVRTPTGAAAQNSSAAGSSGGGAAHYVTPTGHVGSAKRHSLMNAPNPYHDRRFTSSGAIAPGTNSNDPSLM